MNFKTKVIFGDETRVWRTTEPKFTELLAFVQGAWGDSLPNQWKLQYNDTDGDNVTITSQMDLADCVQTMSSNQDKGLRIVVSEAHPSGRPTVDAGTPVVTVAMDSESVDMDYEIVRGGSDVQSLPEEAADLVTKQDEFIGDEKEELDDSKKEARAWAEERINAGRVPTPEQLEDNFKLSPLDSTQIITDLMPAIHDLLAIQAAQAPDPKFEEQPTTDETPARDNSPTGMDLEQLRAKLMSLGFNIQGSEEALRTAVSALTNPNIVIDATAYVDPPAQAEGTTNEGPAPDGAPCGWRDILKQFVDDEDVVAGLTGPFVDVLYASIQEGEDTMVALQSAVASSEQLANSALIKKLLPFMAGYSDQLKQGLMFLSMMGPDALRNLLTTAVTTARTYLSGNEGACAQCPLFNMSNQFFPGLHNVFQQFKDANSVPEVRRDDQGRVLHMGVVCDGCGMDPITGVRYKDAVKPDYDLCAGCEQSRDNRHYPMIKYEFPASACDKNLPGLQEAFRQAKRRNRGYGQRPRWGGRGRCGRGRWGKWARENFNTPGQWDNGAWAQPSNTPQGPTGGRGGRCPWRGGRGWGGHRGGGWGSFGAKMAQMFAGRGGGCPFMSRGGNTMQTPAANDSEVATEVVGEYKARNIANVGKVIEARYGDMRVFHQNSPFASAKDVTDKVQAMLGDDHILRLEGVRTLNQHFGDPAVGVVKKLRIRYMPHKQKQEAKPAEEGIFQVTVSQRPMGFRYDGVKVTSVWRDGRAFKAGLRAGHTILMVNGQDVDSDTITTMYRSAPLPFQMVIARPQPVPTKVVKLDAKIKQMSRQINKVSKTINKTDKKAKNSEKQIAKAQKQVAKQQKQLVKQQKKLENGKGGLEKTLKKIEKGSAKLSNQAANLEKRKAKHAEFVQRLEAKRTKMQVKLRKMEEKLAKMSEKRQKALQDRGDWPVDANHVDDREAYDDEEPTMTKEEFTLEEHSTDEQDEEQPADPPANLWGETQVLLDQIVNHIPKKPLKEWSCPSCGMRNRDSVRCGSCGQDRPLKVEELALEEPPSDDEDETFAKEQEERAPVAPKAEPFHVAPDHPYYQQNTALLNMGFTDEVHNIHILAQCDGNLQQTISQLVDASAHNI